MSIIETKFLKTIRRFSIVIVLIGILVCSTIPVQAEFDSETLFTKGVLLNKPDITYDLSQLEKFPLKQNLKAVQFLKEYVLVQMKVRRQKRHP